MAGRGAERQPSEAVEADMPWSKAQALCLGMLHVLGYSKKRLDQEMILIIDFGLGLSEPSRGWARSVGTVRIVF